VTPAHPNAVCRRIARFHLDRLSRGQVGALREAQEIRLLIRDLPDGHRRVERALEQRMELSVGNRAVGLGDGVAVRIEPGAPEHLVDALDEPIGDDVLELFGLFVHLIPSEAQHPHQEQLDQAVASQHERGELPPRLREANAAVRFVLHEPRVGQRLHHGRRRPRRDPKRLRELAGGQERIGGCILLKSNGLQVVFDGRTRKHGD
jgi:hypothetical protein